MFGRTRRSVFSGLLLTSFVLTSLPAPAQEAAPAGLLVFSHGADWSHSELWVMNADGSERRSLLANSSVSYRSPA
jgi:hypothetical protein